MCDDSDGKCPTGKYTSEGPTSPPRPGDKFQVGNIVRFRGSASNSAAPGAVAVVLGYHDYRAPRPPYYRTDGPTRYLDVFWLSSLAGSQVNGGYIEDHFDLLHEDFRMYRPDISPEDRGLDVNHIKDYAIQGLKRAVDHARAAGFKVDAAYEREVVKTETVEL